MNSRLRELTRGDLSVPGTHIGMTIILLLGMVLPVEGAPRNTAAEDTAFSVRRVENLLPHFEPAADRKIFYVDGWPFTILSAEIPWWDILYGDPHPNLTVYDYLYPAARSLGMNTLKVPIKWSMVEPSPGVYDFSYLDHVKRTAEQHGLKLVLGWFGHYASSDGTIYVDLKGDVFAPMDIIRDDKTYPRAIDADGVPHHNAASYEHDAIIKRETAAFSAFMEHLRKIDADTRTVLMVQIENEIAVFGWDRRNRKLWRDHSSEADRLFKEKGFTDDLRYSAWRLSTNWIRPLTNAGGEIYRIPLFLNFVGGKLAPWMVGGAPGEDVATYLENCPHISFVGVNSYPQPDCSLDEFRSILRGYRVGRNIPAITEMNSDRSPVAPRLAYVAIGEYGAPIVAPWALSTSTPGSFQPYVQPDGSLANGAFILRDCYTSLSKALPVIAYYAGTEKLKVFMASLPHHPFSDTTVVDGVKVRVAGEGDGQAIVIHPVPREVLLIGFRSHFWVYTDAAKWPDLQQIKIESVVWTDGGWREEGTANYIGIDQSERCVSVDIELPQAVRVRW